MLRKTLQNLPYYRPYLITVFTSILVFFPTWWRLANQWIEFEQVLAHGLATALIFIGLLLVHPPSYNPATGAGFKKPRHVLGGILLLITTLAWATFELIRIDTLAFFALPAGLLLIAWTLLGLNRAISFLPYVLLLTLSLPFWTDLIPQLVQMASTVVGQWLDWMGISILIEGNSITLPYGHILIADGCSGIRYFAISILLAMMTAVLNDYRWKGWAACVLIAAALGLLANWIRIFILVLVAYDTHMKSGLLVDHELMGWLVYAAFVLPCLYLAPVHKRQASQGKQHPAPINYHAFGFILAALVIGTFTLLGTSQNYQQPSPHWKLSASGPESKPADQLPVPMTLPDNLNQQVWRDGLLWISVAQSQKQTSDDKLVPYFRTPFDPEAWHRFTTDQEGVSLYRNVFSRDQAVIAQWYEVGSYRATSYRTAKLMQIPATLRGQRRFALVTLQMACDIRSCDAQALALKQRMQSVRLLSP